jgi:Ca2+-transporting ATPase
VFLIEVKSLQVDESLLTGESEPVEKTLDSKERKSIDSRSTRSSIYMGTIVTRGRERLSLLQQA